jgi:hypothetical protein
MAKLTKEKLRDYLQNKWDVTVEQIVRDLKISVSQLNDLMWYLKELEDEAYIEKGFTKEHIIEYNPNKRFWDKGHPSRKRDYVQMAGYPELKSKLESHLEKLAKNPELPSDVRSDLSRIKFELSMEHPDMESIKDKLENLSNDRPKRLTKKQSGDLYSPVCWIEDFLYGVK